MDRNNKGFTLVELLVVISIIGILAALITANFTGVRARARDAKRKAEMEQIQKALRLYYNDFQMYPVAATGDAISGCVDGTQPCSWGTSSFEANGNVYMKLIPKEPLPSPVPQYRYYQNGDSDTFCVAARLENAGDPAAAESQARCVSDCVDPSIPVLDAQDFVMCSN